jgi:predicted component of type VI protein secretion system
MRVAPLVLGLLFVSAAAVHAADELYPQGRPARVAPAARLERAGRLAREAPPIPKSRSEGALRRLENDLDASTTRRSDSGAGQFARGRR